MGLERAERRSFPKPRLSLDYLGDLAWKAATGVLGIGARLMHGIEIDIDKAPRYGPVLFLTSHFSILDVFSLLVANPYQPRTMYAIKKELADIPVLGGLITSWGAVPVARDGHDIAAMKAIMQAVNKGRSVCIAAGGTRSRDGHLTPIDDMVVKLVLRMASRGVNISGERVRVPIHSIVETGTDLIMPPGRIFPRRGKIKVIAGDEINLAPALVPGLTEDNKMLIAAGLIQKSLADLLPPENQPKPGMPIIWTKTDYMDPVNKLSHYSLKELKKKAKERLEEVPVRIAEKRVYIARNPVATDLTTRFWDLFLRGRNVKGLENFDKAIAAYSDAVPLTLVAPHVSDADTLFIDHSLRDTGRSEYANKLLYIAGLNMDERWYIKMNIQGGNRAYFETPLVMEDLEEALRAGKYFPSRNCLQKYMDVARGLNYVALKEVIRARKDKEFPQIVVLYPQSTRSSDGFIKEGHPDTEVHLKKGVILPVMMRGSEKFMPAKKIPPFLNWIAKGGIVDVEFGEPFQAEEFKLPEVREGLAEMGATPVDLVMARIGSLDWERMDPTIRPFHQMLHERFPVVPLAA